MHNLDDMYVVLLYRLCTVTHHSPCNVQLQLQREYFRDDHLCAGLTKLMWLVFVR